ncbi:DUF1800 domain-containing protein [Paracoccus lutimaris]|uniref:Uncharacterized protein (DUF1800 family) n=1 Tax=Paracoccus lutimaris TaxID=1490030 RepID=A0A368Z660_9RHOB|nr:DUF1800 domain-containing protein [Paracoccus lutimaris]RCW86707.1 uncharacterized protein (DUF1800 family) [Paracoccus lutimaris]
MSFGFPELAAIRLGYGLSPLMPPPADVGAVLASVDTAGPGPEAVSTDDAREMSLRLREMGEASKTAGEAAAEEYRAFGRMLSRMMLTDLQRRIARAVDDPVGFGERLVQFWSDHFTTRPLGAAVQPLGLAFVDEAIRPHVNGRFEDMFFAADTHPMMLVYLNQNESRGPNSTFAKKRKAKGFGLNENLAREALELHSMGVGAPYAQKDVRELAELLTGLTYSREQGFAYRPQMAEPGAETVLGKSYGGGKRDGLEAIRAALTDIARRPETAQYVARKLAVHFVSDDPPEDLVQAMTAVWRDSQGDLPQVYRVLVTHPALADTLRQKVRQPYDLLVAGFRALGVSGAQIAGLEHPLNARMTFDPMNGMGQPWGRQAGPDGWPEEAEAWIAPQQLAARINWSLSMPRRMLEQLPDPRELMQASLGGTQSAALAWAVPKAESAAEGVALILASSDFNRR